MLILAMEVDDDELELGDSRVNWVSAKKIKRKCLQALNRTGTP